MLSSLQATCAKFSCRNNNVFHFLMHSFLRFSILIVNSGGIKVKIPLCLCQDIPFSQSIHHILDKFITTEVSLKSHNLVQSAYTLTSMAYYAGIICTLNAFALQVCWHACMHVHSYIHIYVHTFVYLCMY